MTENEQGDRMPDSERPNQSSDYRATLTPRVFQMSRNDWHIAVAGPDGQEVWDSSPWRWTARLKARLIVRRMKRGWYGDKRRAETFDA